ncbi:Sec39 domain-containing protein [Stachybotrys elegans]|uniref:Sec39 domain-containing protein n=1 Tax=Stachybotrys elegans TaxID=80388 RepID=A0A8K0WNG0_9HYPO|nr:Sec39 domain-containing protein [Stachybotrys elegans]
MAALVSPAKVVLLAVHLAAHGDLTSLAALAAREATVLRKELLLRILLTHLPETVPSNAYVGFLEKLRDDQLTADLQAELDISPVESLSEEQASRRVTKLHLLKLALPDAPTQGENDPITLFLFHRAYRVDEEAGMLPQLPDLLLPFIDHSPAIRAWAASTILPLLRRNFEYYPHHATPYTLLDFQRLPDPAALEYLLSQTSLDDSDGNSIGRDLRGMVAPWLHNEARWRQHVEVGSDTSNEGSKAQSCPAWEKLLEWILLQSTSSWRTAAAVIEQWNGPQDIELLSGIPLQYPESRQRFVEDSYTRAAIAATYLINESTLEALEGAYRMASKISAKLNEDLPYSLRDAVSGLSDFVFLPGTFPRGAKLTAFMRNDLLEETNPLTAPNPVATRFLVFLIISAFLSARLGVPCTIRKAGDLAMLKDQREQKGEILKLIRSIASHGANHNDEHWVRARNDLLWLHSWGVPGSDHAGGATHGIFGAVSKEFIETEFLKTLLANTRYTLAKRLYEDDSNENLSIETIQDVVYQSALHAFDNASNPNRTRGGLKKCDDTINALPRTMSSAMHLKKRVEALLKAAHALSDYRLVLRQGEPFSPVVLRVHSDPISIIDRVLEQNPRAYTRLQEFSETGFNMMRAGLLSRSEGPASIASSENQFDDMAMVEKRIVAMCVEAALRENDFETAYSYVMSRLGTSTAHETADEWSWSAALKAGQYTRTEASQQPTHLGTASGNLEIRHLEHRLDCLATALRIAPQSQLQEILKTFRRCEEQLDSAIQEEAAKEAAWDAVGDVADLPGAFDTPQPPRVYPPRNSTASAAARHTEEAPMSLFDLSRATARAAQKNFTALSSLQVMGQDKSNDQEVVAEQDQQRVRKRDQLRDAATETLVSGVGWLIGANVQRGRPEAS